ncbi:GTP-binding protein [Mesobacillus maritimus]|uniref:GTP-binding protein n=1 Tax=Mesobacillus maritimus TaxID=1643336 RepID=UPI00384BE7BD
MNKTIGVLAHVDAGKTTFSEQLLYHTNSIKQRGRVDHQDAFLDSHKIERQRGITVFADQGMFTYNDSTYYLIDTPGHIDFSPEMERAIQVMDYAIVIISAVEGIEGHSETVWELLRKHQVPTFFFINKTDRVGADVKRVIEEIKLNLSNDVCELSTPLLNEDLNEELVEFVAERNEDLLDFYMENGYEKERWFKAMQKMVKENQLFPCSSGLALQDKGIASFLENLEQLTVTDYENESSFGGRVYKIRHDDNGMRITFIKAIKGTLKVRDEISYGSPGDPNTEKVTQIRIYSGRKYKTVDSVEAGQLFAVVGLTNATVGDGLGVVHEKSIYEMIPTLKSKVMFEQGINSKEALMYFRTLEAEDPALNVLWEENLQEIHLHVMGAIQLEILEQLVMERFGLKVSFAEPEIMYKETIQSTVNGYGHFEPLGHYAEVHLRIQPIEQNRGIIFENQCHADDLSVGNQNLIQHHLFEQEHHGLLTGSPLTDVKVTLLTGRAHNKHTAGGDFREATYRALRQGLEKAENFLLEPVYQYKIKVDLDHMGRVLADIQTAYGSFNPPKTIADKAIITGTVPVATFMNYPGKLAAFTHGKGLVSLIFAGYERCHNQREIIEKIAYNKNADPKYTSSSIFCSKGQAYNVPWHEAEGEMHGL